MVISITDGPHAGDPRDTAPLIINGSFYAAKGVFVKLAIYWLRKAYRYAREEEIREKQALGS